MTPIWGGPGTWRWARSRVVGGWGGRVVGISSINGVDASENETYKDHEFKTGQWYRVRVKVTKKKVEVESGIPQTFADPGPPAVPGGPAKRPAARGASGPSPELA